MSTTVKISRIIGATGDPTNARITIKVQLEDGSEGQLVMDGPTAQALLPTVHQTVLKLVDRMRGGPRQMGQVAALDIQSVHMGHDPQTNMSIILFDQGKPSEMAYRLLEKHVRDLEQGLAQVTKALSGKSREKHH